MHNDEWRRYRIGVSFSSWFLVPKFLVPQFLVPQFLSSWFLSSKFEMQHQFDTFARGVQAKIGGIVHKSALPTISMTLPIG
jgi:hypothetical protein